MGALLSLTGGNGLVPLFVGLEAHTLVRGHRPPDFSGPPEEVLGRMDRNGRRQRERQSGSRAYREPGPGEVGRLMRAREREPRPPAPTNQNSATASPSFHELHEGRTLIDKRVDINL